MNKVDMNNSFSPVRERKETKNHLVVMACLERKYEDPIFSIHKIVGPECSDLHIKTPKRNQSLVI
jgi:hypothetical protein